MKVNQIVNEHKKGVRAMKYGKKTKGAVPVYGPDANNAKLKPVKPTGTISEEAKITKTGPDGVEITADTGIKTTLPADKAAALQPDPQNPNEYDLNPAATAPTGGDMAGPKVGANVEIKTAEDTGSVQTIPTQEFVKGVYSIAAEYKGEAPNPEEVKKLMVLAPNGEVDVEKTFTKIYAAFQASIPQIEQMIKEIDALINSPEGQAAMANQAPEVNPELTRIRELSGMTDEDTVSPRFNGYQQTAHDNGDTTDDYSAGPVSLKTRKDAKGNTVSTDAQYELGPNTINMNQNQVGVKTIGATGPQADQFVGTDASARRLGVDPSKVQRQLAVKENAELTAMLTIAGLR